jgi:hypothetical protein
MWNGKITKDTNTALRTSQGHIGLIAWHTNRWWFINQSFAYRRFDRIATTALVLWYNLVLMFLHCTLLQLVLTHCQVLTHPKPWELNQSEETMVTCLLRASNLYAIFISRPNSFGTWRNNHLQLKLPLLSSVPSVTRRRSESTSAFSLVLPVRLSSDAMLDEEK